MRFLRFLDKMEDKIRFALSRWPVVYTLIGGIAIVLFWRGVWLTADYFVILNGPISLAVSIIILLSIGLFVSFFIGDQILISGMKQEKKITEKTEAEIKAEGVELAAIKQELQDIRKKIEEIGNKMHGF